MSYRQNIVPRKYGHRKTSLLFMANAAVYLLIVDSS